jgi:hypothetical protein
MELANDLAFGIINLRTRAAHAEAKLKLDFPGQLRLPDPPAEPHIAARPL